MASLCQPAGRAPETPGEGHLKVCRPLELSPDGPDGCETGFCLLKSTPCGSPRLLAKSSSSSLGWLRMTVIQVGWDSVFYFIIFYLLIFLGFSILMSSPGDPGS